MQTNIEDIYIDQAPQLKQVVTSFYTSYGIKCIDSEYASIIQNIHQKIKNIWIRKWNSDTWEHYYKLADKEDLNIQGRLCGEEVVIVYENNSFRAFDYLIPLIMIKENKFDVSDLKAQIKSNIHLHKLIKENLINNLNTYILNY